MVSGKPQEEYGKLLNLDEKEVQEAAQKDARDTQKDYNIIIDTVVEDYDKEMEELINESN